MTYYNPWIIEVVSVLKFSKNNCEKCEEKKSCPLSMVLYFLAAFCSLL